MSDTEKNVPGVSNLATVLIVDDEPLSLATLRRTLEEEFDIRTADNVAAAERILAEESVQVVISDQRMPDTTGGEFLSRVRERWPDVVRMIISAYTDPQDLIQGINDAGIYQFIPKPWHPEHLLLILRNATRLYRLQEENKLLCMELKLTTTSLDKRIQQQRQRLKENYSFGNIVRAPGSPMNAICERVQQVAPFDIPVLITGESGTGKELITRALHYNSLRADKPFVMENCGAMPVQLLESEMFGHTKGAFTGAANERVGLLQQADGGTVFLDEIGDTSLEFQVKLLRFLQEGEIRPLGSNQRRTVDVRIISATNRDLEEEVRVGRFREDLFYRLSPMPMQLPPLRERPMDIPVLAEAILDKAMQGYGKRVAGFSDEALACMQEYAWPGNVRELENEVRRVLVLATGDQLGADLLSSKVIQGAVVDPELPIPSTPMEGSLKERVETLEARILKETLIRLRWNKSRAAQELGLSRVGLRSKLERYALNPN